MKLPYVKQKTIREFFIKNSEEFKEAKKIKKDIEMLLYEIVESALNNSERAILSGKYSILNTTKAIDISCYGSFSATTGIEIGDDDRFKGYYYYNNQFDLREVYHHFSNYTIGDDNNALPIPAGFSSWKNFKLGDTKKFDQVVEKFNFMFSLLDILVGKIKELNILLNTPEIGLLDIKKSFPLLYKQIKKE